MKIFTPEAQNINKVDKFQNYFFAKDMHHALKLLVEPEPEEVPPEPTEEDSRGVDLDTRLAMLMQKGKSNMPPFLVGSESSADEAPAPEPEKPAPPPVPVNTGPLSRTPSPFASRLFFN